MADAKPEFKDDLFHGHGTMSYRNGDVYEGEWSEGLTEGKGEMRYRGGDKVCVVGGMSGSHPVRPVLCVPLAVCWGMARRTVPRFVAALPSR